jgi:chemotaxis protein MotB
MRRRGAEESTNTEAWLTTYSDLMSLLLCFFVLLFAFSAIDVVKFQEVIISMRGALGILEGGPAVLNANQLPVPSNPIQQDLPTGRSHQIAQVAQKVSALLQEKGIAGEVEVAADYRRGVVIRFRDAVLFDFAKADIRPDSRDLLMGIADILKELPNEVVIEGHTDNIPVIRNSEFESNWDLSTKRSVRVLSFLIESAGVGPPERLSASGYGEYRPLVANDSEHNRAQNRRVDIVLLVPDPEQSSEREIPAQAVAAWDHDFTREVVSQ